MSRLFLKSLVYTNLPIVTSACETESITSELTKYNLMYVSDEEDKNP